MVEFGGVVMALKWGGGHGGLVEGSRGGGGGLATRADCDRATTG